MAIAVVMDFDGDTLERSTRWSTGSASRRAGPPPKGRCSTGWRR